RLRQWLTRFPRRGRRLTDQVVAREPGAAVVYQPRGTQAPGHAFGMLGRVTIARGRREHVLRDVVAQKRGYHHQVRLAPGKILGKQPTLVEGGIAANARVDHPHVAVSDRVQVALEDGRERLLVRHLTTNRVTVAEHDDAKLARWLGVDDLWPDHTARICLQD